MPIVVNVPQILVCLSLCVTILQAEQNVQHRNHAVDAGWLWVKSTYAQLSHAGLDFFQSSCCGIQHSFRIKGPSIFNSCSGHGVSEVGMRHESAAADTLHCAM